MKLIKILLIGIVLFSIKISPVAAVQEPFISTNNVQYAVDDSGSATVTYDISITNNDSLRFPREYHLLVNSLDIHDVVAYDAIGVITPILSQHDKKSDIQLTFRDTVVGLGQKLSFTIRYQTGDIAKKTGTIWEILIPQLPQEYALGEFNVTLQAPAGFGTLAYINPKPLNGNTWTREQIIKSDIIAVFGDTQYYKVLLKYNISNREEQENSYYIRIPPDTLYQKSTIDTLIPLPEYVEKDVNGHWIGKYTLSPKQEISIEAIVYVAVSVLPQDTQYHPNTIPPDTYLSLPQEHDPIIVSLAQNLTTPESIYEYITSTLSFDDSLQKITEKPKNVTQVLGNPSKSSTFDFISTFSSIGNAASIPTRSVRGLALSRSAVREPVEKSDTLMHTWLEYYDKNLAVWIPIDPTWGTTSGEMDYFQHLDFRHIALSVGDTQIPYLHDQIGLSLLDQPILISSGKIAGSISFPGFAISGIPTGGTVTIENSSNLTIHKIHALMQSSYLPFTFDTSIESLTPYSEKQIPFTVPFKNFFTFGMYTLKLTVNDTPSSHTYYQIPLLPILVICVLLMALLKLAFRVLRFELKVSKQHKPPKIWKIKKK